MSKKQPVRHNQTLPAKQTTPQANRVQPRAGGQAMQVQSVTQHQVFEGPMPPPSVLEGYEQVVTGAAERLLRMAEQEASHRHALEVKATDANISAQKRQLDIAESQSKSSFRSDTLGQIFGFIVSAVCIGAAIYFAVMGSLLVAGIFLSLPVVGLVKAFVTSPRASRDPDKKSQ